MALKHFLATAATTAIVATLVAVGAGTAQATPLPVPPGPINLPIYTQPSYPGFHVPPSIRILKPGPVLKPGVPVQFRPFGVAPTRCDQLFPGGTPQAGAVLSADHTVHSTIDANLAALLNAQPSLLNCNWTNPSTGLQLEVSVALINSSLIPTITAYLNALGTYTGDGVGADVVSSESATGTAVERQTLSTNDFWLVTRTNDGLGPVYDQSLITALWGLNGLTAADFE